MKAYRALTVSLARIGITKPTAEQIQAALIGGEIALSNGSTTRVRDSVSVASRDPYEREVSRRLS